ncbi:unnamed protein product [Rhizophagus irregularis]|uniref:Uncharacterized protein n=1 Tax=Rhizophagus irregularis TaxID=588596 RepID=A0A916E9M9_9GLOM|nr:unnamed protein product [Rhizophagus irregularis]
MVMSATTIWMVEVGYPSGRQLQDDSTRTYDFVTLQDSDFVEWRNGESRGRWTRTGQRYYQFFRSRFWEQPGNY